MVTTRIGSSSNPLPRTPTSTGGRRALLARRCAYILFVAALALVTTLPLMHWLDNATWHDQQRMGQVLASALAVAGSALIIGPGGWRPPPLLGKASQTAIALILAAAMVSASQARQPLWGFVEVALGLACLGLGWIVATLRRWQGTTLDRVLLGALFFTCTGLMARFVAAYLAATVGDVVMLDAWLLIDGFSNPRFYGQFLTLALPLLVAPLLAIGGLRRYALIAGILTWLAWTAAITSGTRGTWLGLACAMVVLACAGPAGRRWAMLQSTGAAAGAALFWFAMTVVPDLLGITVANHATTRLSTSLSGREIIWSQAIDMALSHPLLGIGPMQLADFPNGVAAHPHQAWLQWAAELGFPSALLMSALLVRGAWHLLWVLRTTGGSNREPDVLRVCLTGSVVAALTQAMVDGVLVMPYSQLWLALIAGWLVGLAPVAASTDSAAAVSIVASRYALSAWLAALVAAVILLGYVVERDYPRLAQREEVFAKTFGGPPPPRFWAQGIIAQAK